MDNLIENLQGLGVIKRKGGQVTPATRKFQDRTVTRSKANLLANADNLPATTKAKIARDQVIVEDRVYYFRKEITTSGIIKLILPTDDKTANVKNFDKDKLPTGENLSLRRLEVNYKAEASSGSPTTSTVGTYRPLRNTPVNAGNNSGTAVDYLTADDDAILHAEMTLKVGGRTVFNAPLNTFLEGEKGNTITPQNGYNFENQVMIRDDESISCEIELPAAIAAPASSKYFIEVKFRGSATADR